ncbi:MAG: hypothetical protein HY319_32260 [Armatimonadetes bacterium]|nr:hypothetical protein [Armatimonadota bacterium]
MSEPLSELDGFLEGQPGRLDSSGSFTIAPDKARITLGASATAADPAYWLLKLIQAATAAEAEKLTIGLGRQRARLSFRTRSAGELLPSRALVALAAGRTPAAGPARHLHLALTAAAAGDLEGFRYNWWGGERSEALLYRGGELSMVPAGAAPSRTETEFLQFELLRSSGIPLAWSTAAEHQAVCKRSLVPLGLDGRYLDGVLRLPIPARGSWMPDLVPFHLCARFKKGEGFLCGIQAAEPPERPMPQGGLFYLSGSPPIGVARCSEAMFLPSTLEDMARVYVVEDGVVLKPLRCDLGLLGLVVFTTRGGLRLDALGMRVVGDESWEERRAELEEQADRLKRGLRRRLSSLEVQHGQQPQTAAPAAGALCTVAGLAMALLSGNLWLLPVGPLCGLGLALWNGDGFAPEDLQVKARQAIRRRLDQAQEGSKGRLLAREDTQTRGE